METVILDRYFNLYEAQLAKDKLENSGIECQISDEYSLVCGNFSQGIKLRVFEQDYAKALRIISE